MPTGWGFLVYKTILLIMDFEFRNLNCQVYGQFFSHAFQQLLQHFRSLARAHVAAFALVHFSRLLSNLMRGAKARERFVRLILH